MGNESDSSGTADDLAQTQQNRGIGGGCMIGNGRTAKAGPPCRVQNNMETQIHQLEKEAYCSVLRAFKAQADAITWEKESLITELRKELSVSDEQHRELLSSVNTDGTVRGIREWRKSAGLQSVVLTNAQAGHDSISSPTYSTSLKRQKRSQPIPSLSVTTATFKQPFPASMQLLKSTSKKAAPVEAKPKKSKSGFVLPGMTIMKSMQFPSSVPSGRDQTINIERDEAIRCNPLITEGDTCWNAKVISCQVGPIPDYGKMSSDENCKISGSTRGRGYMKSKLKKDFSTYQNFLGNKQPNMIAMINDQRFTGASHADIFEAMETKKDHEQSPVDAISRVSNWEDYRRDPKYQLSHGQYTNRG